MNGINEEQLFALIRNAKSYFITTTIKDPDKAENNLSHYTIRKEFPVDDMVPSVDNALRSLQIKLEQPPTVVIPPPLQEKRKPLKIAIITHFNRCPDSYSPGRAVKHQIKLLQHFGHEVVFFLAEGSQLKLDCEMRPVVTRFHRQKSIIDKEAKEKFKEVLKRELVGFDLAITQDLYIDDCITYREAIKECGVDIPWLHWARSGVGQPINFDMPNARYVYMNYADSGIFARKIGVTADRIRVVFNEKDPSYMWGWNPITQLVVDKMRLWEKDIIQTYPMCTTRMDAKGIDSVIRIFGILKEMGNRVALVICNSNGRRRLEEIKNKIKYAEEHGLVNGSDFLFTSTLADDEHDISREVPNKVVVELMQVSNLFVFPTVAEVCSNVLLESSMTKNLIVYNTDLPSLADFVNKEAVLAHSFTSLNSVHYSNRGKDDFIELAKKIVVKLRDNYADRQFRRVWSKHNIETLYYEQLEPILYEHTAS